MTDAKLQQTARSIFLDAAVQLAQVGSVEERTTAITALGVLGDETIIPILLEILQHDSNRQVQHKASQAIVRIGGGKAQSGLQQLMRDENQYTRFLAAEALANIVSQGTS